MFIVFKFYLKHSYGLMNRFLKKRSIKFEKKINNYVTIQLQ